MTGLGKDYMEEQSTVGMTEEGANLQEEFASTPPSEESPTSESEEGQDLQPKEATEEESENLQAKEDPRFDRHPRWKQMQKTVNRLRRIERDFESYKSSYGQAIQFHNWLTSNPHLIPKVLQVLKASEGAPQDVDANQDDPFADLDPRIANELRGMKSALEEQKRSELTRSQQAVQEHQDFIDERFDELLAKDGFIQPDGKPVEEIVNVYSVTTRALLDVFAKDKAKPTLQELNKAYAYVNKAIQKLANRSLSKLTKNIPEAPPSGSKKGVALRNVSAGPRAFSNDDIAQMLK